MEGDKPHPHDEGEREALRPIKAEPLQRQARLFGDASNGSETQVHARKQDQEWHDDEDGCAGTHEDRYLHKRAPMPVDRKQQQTEARQRAANIAEGPVGGVTRGTTWV